MLVSHGLWLVSRADKMPKDPGTENKRWGISLMDLESVWKKGDLESSKIRICL